MNANLDKIAKDLYGKIQTRFADIKIGDENATVLSKKEDIPKARFFEFEYEEDGEPLGTIAITLDTDDGIVIQVSGDLVNDDNDTTHHRAFKFIRSFRQFAKDRLLNFDVQNIGKSNLDKRDYQFQSKRKEEPVMAQAPIMENKMYGNARMSYQDLGENARLVVKHSQPVNLDIAAGRTMHIESIYIENAQGERFKYPFKHLNGARALAEHIKHGGTPYDAIGKHISSLSEELSSLRKFKGFVGRQEQVSEAMGNVTGKVIDRIEQIKETIHKLQRSAYYESFVESFQEQEEQAIPEAVANDLINRLTIRTFNEELKAVFPYIYKFVDESQLDVLEINAEDLLDEVFDGDKETGTTHKGGTVAKTKHGIKHTKSKYDDGEGPGNNMFSPDTGRRARAKLDYDASDLPNFRTDENQFDPEIAFENFMNNIISEDKDEIFSPNKDAQHSAIEKLNDILAKELKGGPEGINAINSLKGLIDDPEFLTSLRDIDPDLDVRPLIQQFILATDPNVATQIHFGGEEGGAKEQEAPAPAAPVAAAPAPAAEPAPMPGQEVQAAAPEAGAVPPGPEAPAAPAPVAEGKKDDNDATTYTVAYKDPKKPGKSYSTQVKATSAAEAKAAFQDWDDTGRFTYLGSRPDVDKVHEAKDDNDPPWHVDPKEKKSKPVTPGKHGQGYSQARHLARQGLASALKKAKESGATLETQMDFGNKVMSIAEVLESCGMAPQDVGFEPEVNGLESMLKYVSGFYNRDEGNFPLGGMRVKIKVKKAFEDGEFGPAQPGELAKVLKFIDMKDPSGDEQHSVLRLAGINRPEHGVDEAGEMPVPNFGPMMQGIMDKFKGMSGSNGGMPDVGGMFNQMKDMPGAKVTNTSSGTINGKDASYDDAMSQMGQMKFKMPKFGDDDTDDGEVDFSKPDEMFKRLQSKIGTGLSGAMNKAQVPNQNVQVPGGQLNPQELMRTIMQKMNFNK
jgi:hypothetical protein